MIRKEAYAKINLTLDVVGKRDDGYHLLETVMQTVSLCDVVSVEKFDDIVITCSEPAVPVDERNSCHKAARVFFERTGISGGARIDIEKHIPSEAGLGGGSSDAAAVLSMLNEIYDARLSYSELEELAAKVGADVAFCVRGGTAVCSGIGEDMERLAGVPERWVLLVKPDFGVSTPEAYRLFDEKGSVSIHGTEAFLRALRDDGNPYEFLSNDLEAALCNMEIAKIRRELLTLGAEAAQMTGSGSCVFGVFENEDIAVRAKNYLSGKIGFVELCRTI